MSSTPSPAPAAGTTPSYLSSRFVVQLGAPAQTPVTVVGGIEADTPAVVFREGSVPASTEKAPGQASYPNLVLTRPLTRDLTFWQWMQDSINRAAVKRNISVILLDGTQTPVIQWGFKNAFPVRWTGPVLNAHSNDVAMETLEISHEGLSVTAP